MTVFFCFDNKTVNDVILKLNKKQREYTLLITFKNIMKRVTNQVMLCEIMSHVIVISRLRGLYPV